jgi:putative acetyltransferase
MAVSLFLVGAAGVIVRDRSVLLLKRSRHKDYAPGEWDLVSGRVERGEDVREALSREIAEECGLAVEILQPIDTWRMQRGEYELIGVIHLCRYVGGEVRLSEEHEEFRWVPFEAIDTVPLHANFRRAVFHAAAQHSMLQRMKTQTTVTIAEESPRQNEVAALLRESDAFSAALYPPASIHMIFADELAEPNVRFLVARTDGRAVGCAALVLGQGGQAEIKRMFVSDSARGTGVGRALMDALEAIGAREGVRLIQLETGTKNLDALSLYRRFGYRQRGPFGDYPIDDPLSVYMEKAY